MRRSMDGAVVYQGEVEWELHEEQNEDGWHLWSECLTCGGTERGDRGRDNHVCPRCTRCNAVIDADSDQTLCDACDLATLDDIERCPECELGEVVAAGPMERETGHWPLACSANCGWSN